MPGLAHKTLGVVSRPKSMDGDNTVIEVRAVRDVTGRLKDEIMIVVPLAVEVDEDPLYYYPPKKPHNIKGKLLYSSNDDLEDTESESDSDDEDVDAFDPDHMVVAHTRNALKSAQSASVHPELENSFLEELMTTLDNIFGCSHGGCAESMASPVLKSALRRKGDDVPPIDRNVSFTKLEIREFNMTLGNHPSAVTGPPVMLDWDARPTREAVVDLELYEKARRPRRNRKELKLSFEARRGILENERGFTVEEVKKAWSEALKIRKERQETRLRGPHQQMMDEIYESACRKYSRFTGMFGCQ